jgi:DNA end-binding protein Ku
MRSIWKGAINFGMVTIPVKLYSATEQKDVRFRLLHKKDLSPIVEKRFCVKEDKEVPWEDLVRGYEVRKGEFVALDPSEIEEERPENTHTIDIGDFVELEEIDPIYFEKTYFLEPAEFGAKPFILLKRALEETGRVAVAKVTIRAKERLATLRAYEGTLVLETMYWPDEIRSPSDLSLPSAAKAAPSPKEIQMARALVENLSGRFDPEQYKDKFRSALQELIERKAAGEARNAKRRKPEAKVTDLMEALEASLAAARGSKAGGSAGSKRAGSRSSTTTRASAGAKGSTAARSASRARPKTAAKGRRAA